jgi:uncharacterized membrane protein YozB (DUF420 family)
MRLRYRTGIATFIQFIVMSLLSIVNGIESVVSTCDGKSGSCLSNAFATTVFFVVISLWFASIWLLGYFAQDQRSRRLAYLLIIVEFGVIMIAGFNFQNHTNAISAATSLIDIALASWVIVLAFKLSRSKGGRIMSRPTRHKN